MADGQDSSSTPNPLDFMRGGDGPVSDDLLQATVRTLDHFDALPANETARRVLFDLSQITPGDVVLEAGCGIGHNTRRLARAVGSTGNTIGVDLNPHLLEVARERSADDQNQPEYRVGNVEALELDDATFDVAWCHHTLEWVDDPKRAIDELVRVLKPGGRIVCKSIDWGAQADGQSDPAAADVIVDAHVNQFSHPREARMLPKRFRDRGLEQIHVRGELVFWDSQTLGEFGLVFRRLARAHEAGHIDDERYEYMLSEAEAAQRTGTNYGYQVMLIVGGTKPLDSA